MVWADEFFAQPLQELNVNHVGRSTDLRQKTPLVWALDGHWIGRTPSPVTCFVYLRICDLFTFCADTSPWDFATRCQLDRSP